jgi:hypothetical protein
LEELDLVAKPEARLFAVGSEVARNLTRNAFPRQFSTVLHFSGQAALHRASCVVGREEEFEQFSGSVSTEDVLAVAEEVLNASVPARRRDETLVSLKRSQLSESRKQLIFCYKLAFEEAGREERQDGR